MTYYNEVQKKAQAKYDAKATKQIKLKLNITSDKDILDKLDQMDNKQGYIKELIRKDIGSSQDNFSCTNCGHYFKDSEVKNYCPECGTKQII